VFWFFHWLYCNIKRSAKKQKLSFVLAQKALSCVGSSERTAVVDVLSGKRKAPRVCHIAVLSKCFCRSAQTFRQNGLYSSLCPRYGAWNTYYIDNGGILIFKTVNVVSSPRFVVCTFVLMCREGTVTWRLWGVHLDVCAGVNIAKFLTAFLLGLVIDDGLIRTVKERGHKLAKWWSKQVLYLFFIRCCKICAWLFLLLLLSNW
jgi:hypothetical protein